MINVYAFASVPPFAEGLVRDLRVRWALEEAGIPYRATLVGDGGSISREDYSKIQPFGQIPAIEDGQLKLFESGAIVQYIAERSTKLLPSDPARRAEVVQWMFTALNTIEMPVQNLASIDLFYANEDWAKQRRPGAEEMVRKRLGELAGCLGERPYLAGEFSAADVLMASVLRILRHTDLVGEQPKLAAYLKRCEARPAFARALAGQMEAFQKAA
ncbi:MAG TPA: glutathione S-transferase family protein [Candidatus Limnocylindrales bacterium]|nr:glutathione S-transferase family protein [Candidatus Limnocylindrales bacterium]